MNIFFKNRVAGEILDTKSVVVDTAEMTIEVSGMFLYCDTKYKNYIESAPIDIVHDGKVYWDCKFICFSKEKKEFANETCIFGAKFNYFARSVHKIYRHLKTTITASENNVMSMRKGDDCSFPSEKTKLTTPWWKDYYSNLAYRSSVIVGSSFFNNYLKSTPVPSSTTFVLTTDQTSIKEKGILKPVVCIEEAIRQSAGWASTTWVIGGVSAINQSLKYASEITILIVPGKIKVENYDDVCYLPTLSDKFFDISETTQTACGQPVIRKVYTRKVLS